MKMWPPDRSINFFELKYATEDLVLGMHPEGRIAHVTLPSEIVLEGRVQLPRAGSNAATD